MAENQLFGGIGDCPFCRAALKPPYELYWKMCAACDAKRPDPRSCENCCARLLSYNQCLCTPCWKAAVAAVTVRITDMAVVGRRLLVGAAQESPWHAFPKPTDAAFMALFDLPSLEMTSKSPRYTPGYNNIDGCSFRTRLKVVVGGSGCGTPAAPSTTTGLPAPGNGNNTPGIFVAATGIGAISVFDAREKELFRGNLATVPFHGHCTALQLSLEDDADEQAESTTTTTNAAPSALTVMLLFAANTECVVGIFRLACQHPLWRDDDATTAGGEVTIAPERLLEVNVGLPHPSSLAIAERNTVLALSGYGGCVVVASIHVPPTASGATPATLTVHRRLQGHDIGHTSTLAFLKDSLISTSNDGTIVSWPKSTLTPRVEQTASGLVWTLQLDRDGAAAQSRQNATRIVQFTGCPLDDDNATTGDRQRNGGDEIHILDHHWRWWNEARDGAVPTGDRMIALSTADELLDEVGDLARSNEERDPQRPFTGSAPRRLRVRYSVSAGVLHHVLLTPSGQVDRTTSIDRSIVLKTTPPPATQNTKQNDATKPGEKGSADTAAVASVDAGSGKAKNDVERTPPPPLPGLVDDGSSPHVTPAFPAPNSEEDHPSLAAARPASSTPPPPRPRESTATLPPPHVRVPFSFRVQLDNGYHGFMHAAVMSAHSPHVDDDAVNVALGGGKSTLQVMAAPGAAVPVDGINNSYRGGDEAILRFTGFRQRCATYLRQFASVWSGAQQRSTVAHSVSAPPHVPPPPPPLVRFIVAFRVMCVSCTARTEGYVSIASASARNLTGGSGTEPPPPPVATRRFSPDKKSNWITLLEIPAAELMPPQTAVNGAAFDDDEEAIRRTIERTLQTVLPSESIRIGAVQTVCPAAEGRGGSLAAAVAGTPRGGAAVPPFGSLSVAVNTIDKTCSTATEPRLCFFVTCQ